MTLMELYREWTSPRHRYGKYEVGPLYLTGVDQGAIPPQHQYDETANAMMFVINDCGYCVVEDPDDGYRSSMRDLAMIPPDLVKNRFEPVLVRVEDRDGWLQLVDAATGADVLAFGTDNSDDYYPRFVADFYPQHMSVNSGLAEFKHEDKKDDGERVRRAMNLSTVA